LPIPPEDASPIVYRLFLALDELSARAGNRISFNKTKENNKNKGRDLRCMYKFIEGAIPKCKSILNPNLGMDRMEQYI
jgi:hypothetical protein